LNLPHRGFAVQGDARFDVSAAPADASAKRIQITVGRDVVAVAEVVRDGAEARLCFRESVARLPVRDRARLVDAVFELPAVEPGMRVDAVLPVREVDVLSHVLVHCANAHTHAAGVTCVVEATVISCAAATSERR
jgi:hypothetical protein